MGLPFPDYTGYTTSVALIAFTAVGYVALLLLVVALLVGLVRGVAHLSRRFAHGWANSTPERQDRTSPQ